jgi:hypothetical protein
MRISMRIIRDRALVPSSQPLFVLWIRFSGVPGDPGHAALGKRRSFRARMAAIIDKRAWATKFEMRSPAYTTRVSDLPVIRAA